jgi:hypothetical protein
LGRLGRLGSFEPDEQKRRVLGIALIARVLGVDQVAGHVRVDRLAGAGPDDEGETEEEHRCEAYSGRVEARTQSRRVVGERDDGRAFGYGERLHEAGAQQRDRTCLAA